MSSARHRNSTQKQRRLMRPWWSLWTSWCVVALCALICGSAALAISVLQEQPLYRASATIFVTSAAAKNPALKTTLIASYAQLAITRPVLAAVAAKYPGLTIDTLAQEVSVTTATSSGTFQINVRDPDAARAALLARDMADEASIQLQRTLQRQYAVEEQQLRQDLQSTTTQIEGDTAMLGTTTQPNSQSRALIQSQLVYLRQRQAGDEQALSQLEAAQSQTPNPLRLETVSQGQEVRAGASYTLSAFAALCGFAIGIVLELALAARSQRIRGSHDVEALLGAPVLAVLPPSARELDNELVFPSLPEEIGRDVPRSLFITSVRGPSQPWTVSENFAVSLAGSGRKTLLVDADLRRDVLLGSVRSGIDVPAEPGLSDMVLAAAGHNTTQPVSPADTIHELTSSGPPASDAWAVRVMPRGTSAPNPLAVLRSPAMGAVYQQLLGYGADVVIFAGPPLLDAAEALFLAEQLAVVVLVVDPSHDRRADLLVAIDELHARRARVLGCILAGNKQRSQRAVQVSTRRSEQPSLLPPRRA